MAAELDFDELFDLRRRAHRRMPGGERMVRFRWAAQDGAIWLLPAALVGQQGLVTRAHETQWNTGPIEQPKLFGFWLAMAARQDIWRALRGVPGLMPVVRATPDPENQSVSVLVGAVVPQARANHAIDAVLSDIFQPRRINAWTDWALSKAKAHASGERAQLGTTVGA
ncbi:MAG: hypothetical protein ACFBRM_15930 [Pikeienuella sp.]